NKHETCELETALNSNAAVRYHRKNDKPSNILSVLRGLGTTEKTKTYLKNLGLIYDYPKPVGLLQYLIKIGCEGDGIVMDFFAGSGTTGEAVLLERCETETRKSFVLVQLPEPVEKAAVRNTAQIGIDRVCKVSRRLAEKHVGKLKMDDSPAPDLGFRTFKL